MTDSTDDLLVSCDGHVGPIELNRPPHSFFDHDLIRQIADAAEAFDRDGNTRAIVIAAVHGAATGGGLGLGTLLTNP